MELILLENVSKLGKFGDKVKVAKGYGRNFLVPFGKAVPATALNIEKFEVRRKDLLKTMDEKHTVALAQAAEMQAVTLIIPARAAEEGRLFGSVGAVEIAEAFRKNGIEVKRSQIRLTKGAFREIGDFEVEVHLYAEVMAHAKISIVAEAKKS
jgi:large subunit ribosomal protein L9